MAGEVEAVLFESGMGDESCRVLPSSMIEVAELIGCPVDDLTVLPYGMTGKMVMSRSRQIDHMIEVNRNATFVLDKIHGLPLAIRGPAVCFPHGIPWDVPVSGDAIAEA